MRSRAARALYPFGSIRRVLRGPLRGTRFVVQPSMGVSYALGHDAVTPRFLQNRVRAGMTAYDVGANKGQMTLYLAQLVSPGGRVVSLEPVAREYSILERNLELNGLSWVRPIMAAASESAGRQRFLFHPALPTQGKLASEEPTYQIPGSTESEVAVITLDSLLADEAPPDIMKIDVEGAARAVLRGARQIIERHAPAVFIELHGPEEQQGVADLLLAAGYVAENTEGHRIPDPGLKWESPLWCFRP